MNNKPAHRFSSSFADHFVAFIAFKRSFGYKYIAEEETLKLFDKFLIAEKYTGRGFLRKSLKNGSTEKGMKHDAAN